MTNDEERNPFSPFDMIKHLERQNQILKQLQMTIEKALSQVNDILYRLECLEGKNEEK